MREPPHLTTATDRNGRFSGYYKCSHCVAEFRPNPDAVKEMAFFFAAHVRLSHPAQRDAPEDVAQNDGETTLRNTIRLPRRKVGTK
jgi:hypothetical protein